MCQENVIIVKRKLKDDSKNRAKEYFAMGNVIPSFVKQNFHSTNSTPIKGFSRMGNRDGFIRHDIGNLTQNELLILRQGVMRENGMLKGNILLRSGKNFAESSNGDVLNVRSVRNSPKTTSNRFQRKAQIIFQIFNRFAALATVANGKN